MNWAGRIKRFLGRRWVLFPTALVIGVTSAFLLWIALDNVYLEYWLYPRLKAADGYVFPELRYTAFDVLLILCCLSGLAASVMSVWAAAKAGNISGRTFHALGLYFILPTILIGWGILMLTARSYGY